MRQLLPPGYLAVNTSMHRLQKCLLSDSSWKTSNKTILVEALFPSDSFIIKIKKKKSSIKKCKICVGKTENVYLTSSEQHKKCRQFLVIEILWVFFWKKKKWKQIVTGKLNVQLLHSPLLTNSPQILKKYFFTRAVQASPEKVFWKEGVYSNRILCANKCKSVICVSLAAWVSFSALPKATQEVFGRLLSQTKDCRIYNQKVILLL